jgi:hypothetical protein
MWGGSIIIAGELLHSALFGASGFAFCLCWNVFLGAPFPDSDFFGLTLVFFFLSHHSPLGFVPM